MGTLTKLKTFIDQKKEDSKTKEVVKRLRADPNNKIVISKLDKLYDERTELMRLLHNKELEIDACLYLLYYNDNKL